MKDTETLKMNSMKLMHYFITKENYKLVVIQGVSNEIWLENFDQPYKLVRIVTKRIVSSDDLAEDISQTQKISRRIRLKTFSITMDTLNIYLDCHIIIPKDKKISMIDLIEDDIRLNASLQEAYPRIKTMEYEESDLEFALRATTEINLKNTENARQAKELFKPIKPYVTYGLILINTIIFLLMEISGGSDRYTNLIIFGAQYNPLIKSGEYYRLLTPVFIHIGILHFLVNNYSLYVIGKMLEGFYGRLKFLFIYLGSGILGSLMSFIFVDGVSAGASGAIFGLLGAFAYFGYHNRIILGKTLVNEILPIIAINLLIGFTSTSINNAAHIGGLIGGILLAASVGIKYKGKWIDRLTSSIITIIFTIGLIYIGFFEKEIYCDRNVDVNMVNYYYEQNDLYHLNKYLEKISICKE